MVFTISSSSFKVIHQFKFLYNDSRLQKSATSCPNFAVQCNLQLTKKFTHSFQRKPHSGCRLIASKNSNSNLIYEESNVINNWENEELIEEDDEGSPWEGAIIYKRNSSITHVEYCTTLERLGLGKHSSEISKKRASEMGLKVIKAVNKDNYDGTPVLISIDVTRRKHNLRLDGIIRTVLSLGCNRCGEPAGESIYSNFSLLLCEEPIEEPDTITMGTIFGDDKFKSFGNNEEEGDDDSIDLDDRLYFPREEKTIDISKQIRDMIHVEITFNAICDPMCKGICLKCGVNLNVGKCTCATQKVEEKGQALKKQMQQK